MPPADAQSKHHYKGSDGSLRGQYGNGWTNTFDAHIATNDAKGISVYDATGARFDYALPGGATALGPNMSLVPPAGMKNTSLDIGANEELVTWTGKSGNALVFYGTLPASQAGYDGHLYQIVRRNHHAVLAFAYAWDNGDASPDARLNQISVTVDTPATSAPFASLAFTDFNGRRLLAKLVFPDKSTAVSYQYDAAGNLLNVTKPSNGHATLPVESYMTTTATGTYALAVAGPRSTYSKQTDGGYTTFNFNNNAPGVVQYVNSVGVMNFAPPDGTNTLLQPSIAAPATGTTYRTLAYHQTAGGGTYNDTNGHNGGGNIRGGSGGVASIPLAPDWDSSSIAALKALGYTSTFGNAAVQLGTVLIPGLGDLAEAVAAAASYADTEAIASEGIYSFRSSSGKTYVGQSGNLAVRIVQHLASGKLLQADIFSLKASEVLDERTAREIAEQLKINQLGGIESLENIRNRIGPARRYLLP